VSRYERVGTLDDRRCASGRSRRELVAERVEQLDPGGAPRGDPTARTNEVPGREPFVLGQVRDERRGVRVPERQERNAPSMVRRVDDTPGEAAQPATAVVEQNRPRDQRHEPDSAAPGIPRLTPCRT